MIRAKRAQEIAASWYGGQWTGLYKIVCNEKHNVLSCADLDAAIDETTREWSIQAVADKRAARSLDALRNYLLKLRHAKGGTI